MFSFTLDQQCDPHDVIRVESSLNFSQIDRDTMHVSIGLPMIGIQGDTGILWAQYYYHSLCNFLCFGKQERMKSLSCSLLFCGAFAALTSPQFTGVAEAFAPTSPVVFARQTAVNHESNSRLVVGHLETKEKVGRSCTTLKGTNLDNDENDSNNKKPLLPENSLVLPAAWLGSIAVATQAGSYVDFFQSLSQMKANMAADPTDFWPAVNFWIFFAAGHAILQPIFWISEVLHASPGPLIGNLVPVTFLVGNIIAIAAFTFVKEVRRYLVVALEMRMKKCCLFHWF